MCVARVTATLLIALGTCHAAVTEKEGPLTKVILLLKDMQKEVAAEAKEDKKMHDEIMCWCKTNTEGKTKAVEDAKKKDDELMNTIEIEAAKVSALQVDIDDLKKDIAENEKSLAEAEALRKKEAAEFHQSEKDLIQAIGALDGAIVTLSKHHESMLQADLDKDPAVMTMKPQLRRLIHRHLDALELVLNPENKRLLAGFLNAQPYVFEHEPSASAPSFLQTDAHLRGGKEGLPFKGYAPQSGQIFGILKQMKESFEEDRVEQQTTEQKKVEDHATMTASLKEELVTQKESVKTKRAELADAKEALATAKNDLEDTREAMSADNKHLLEITEKCTAHEFEWEKRLKERTDEMKAISEAIAILDADDVRDAQTTTFGFLQMGQTKVSRKDSPRSRAITVVKKAMNLDPKARLQMGALLSSLQIDAFTKVKAFIDKLIEDLKKEQADEVKQRDFCIGALDDNLRAADKTRFEHDQLDIKVTKLTEQSEAIAEELKVLAAEIADIQVEMQRAGDDRTLENQEFQKTVSDQHLVQEVLKKAMAKLKGFYQKRHSLMQKQNPKEILRAPEPMPEMKPYENNSKSTGVIGLMEKLIGEAKIIEDGAVHDENQAQKSYEKLVTESNLAVRAKQKAITDKTEEKATVDQAKQQAIEDRAQAIKDLETLAEEEASLHTECDFLLKNFDVRQSSRQAEMDALQEVKAILSGMK